MSSGISEGIGNSIFSYTIGEIENCCIILGIEFCHYFFFWSLFLKVKTDDLTQVCEFWKLI